MRPHTTYNIALELATPPFCVEVLVMLLQSTAVCLGLKSQNPTVTSSHPRPLVNMTVLPGVISLTPSFWSIWFWPWTFACFLPRCLSSLPPRLQGFPVATSITHICLLRVSLRSALVKPIPDSGRARRNVQFYIQVHWTVWGRWVWEGCGLSRYSDITFMRTCFLWAQNKLTEKQQQQNTN